MSTVSDSPRKTLRIGVDCTSLSDGYVGGINTYLRCLVQALIEERNSHSIHLFGFETNRSAIEKFSETLPAGGFSFSIIPNRDRNYFMTQKVTNILLRVQNWAQSKQFEKLYVMTHTLLNRKAIKSIDENVDFFYCPATSIPFFRMKSKIVVSLHDIQHLHYPQFFDETELKYRTFFYKLYAYCSDYIHASTRAMQSDFIECYPLLKRENIFIVSEGVDLNRFYPDQKRVAALEVLPKHFIFYPAQLWFHKNHLTLLKALVKIRTETGLEIPLIMTGGKYTSAEEVFKFIEKNNLTQCKHLGMVDAELMPELYRRATILVQPSLFESSSLPILEARASGTAVLASHIPPLKEQAESLSMVLFDPHSVDDLANKLLPAYENAKLQENPPRDANIGTFSWNEVARKYLAFFEHTSKKTFSKC